MTGPAQRRGSGFTLVELLVVVFLTALIAGVTVPNFVRSLRTQRLRSAARTVATAHKYARNMSVLRQTPMAIIFNAGSDVEVMSIRDRFRLPASSMFLDGEGAPPPALSTEGGTNGEEAAAAPETEEEFAKDFEQDVEIESMELKNEEAKETEGGAYIILYYPNGMSDGFKLRLTDGDRRYAEIETDPLSGDVTTEFSFAR